MNTASGNWNFVIAAYAVTWIIIVGYAVRVHRALAAARTAHDSGVATARGPS